MVSFLSPTEKLSFRMEKVYAVVEEYVDGCPIYYPVSFNCARLSQLKLFLRKNNISFVDIHVKVDPT